MRFNAFFLSFWIYFLGVLLLPFFFSFSPDLQRRGKKRFSLLSPLSLALCVPKAICLSHLFFSPLLFFLLLENYLDRERGGGEERRRGSNLFFLPPTVHFVPIFWGGRGKEKRVATLFFPLRCKPSFYLSLLSLSCEKYWLFQGGLQVE